MYLKNTHLRNLFLVFYLSLVSYVVFRSTVPTYGVNDDVIIQSWLSGSYTGKPESMIRGSATPKILFGYLISNLYAHLPMINWFTIVILFLTLLSWFLIGQLILKMKNKVILIFYFIISFLYLFWFIPSPTYTACGILFSFSVLAFVSNLNSKSFIYYIGFAILYSVSYEIRPESFIFGSLAIFPLIFYNLIRNKNIRLKIFGFFLITGLIVIVDYAFENNYYQKEQEWQIYKELETSRYSIQANRIENMLNDNPALYSWTESQVKLFEQYITLDREFYNEVTYNKLIKQSNQFSQSSNLITYLQNGHKNLINSDVNWEWFNLGKLIPLSFLLMLFLRWPNVKVFLSLNLITYSFLYFSMIYISNFLRQPERVQVSAIFIAILVPLLAMTSKERTDNTMNHETLKLIQFLLIVLILSFSFPQIKYLDSKYSGANSVFWIKQQEFFESFPKEAIFVGNASQFRNNWRNPYLVQESEIEKRIFELGWHNYSPHWNEKARQLGLDPKNMWKSIINNKNVYFVSDSQTFSFILRYLDDENLIYKSVEKVKSLDFVGNDYSVWKFNTK